MSLQDKEFNAEARRAAEKKQAQRTIPYLPNHNPRWLDRRTCFALSSLISLPLYPSTPLPLSSSSLRPSA